MNKINTSKLLIKLKSLFIIILISIFILSCTEDLYDEPTVDDEMVVVSAFLFEGEKIENIRLTRTFPLGSEDTIAMPINEAEIYLSKDGNEYLLQNADSLNGYYVYEQSDLEVKSGDIFSLRIIYNNETITSSTLVPVKPNNVNIFPETLALTTTSTGFGGFASDTNSIKVSWSNPDSTLYYVVIQNLEANPILITYTSGKANSAKVTFPPSATSEFLIGRRNITYFGRHAAIVYKVNQEYADLYESRTQDSRNLNEPISNIDNGLGVFSAFASDTVYFNVVSE
ncbi:MAG: DUF4249 family protein [Ignavibacteriae bacterium]|nr:DUF4249 family protein [Ignavibacteriota bacterium]